MPRPWAALPAIRLCDDSAARSSGAAPLLVATIVRPWAQRLPTRPLERRRLEGALLLIAAIEHGPLRLLMGLALPPSSRDLADQPGERQPSGGPVLGPRGRSSERRGLQGSSVGPASAHWGCAAAAERRLQATSPQRVMGGTLRMH